MNGKKGSEAHDLWMTVWPVFLGKEKNGKVDLGGNMMKNTCRIKE